MPGLRVKTGHGLRVSMGLFLRFLGFLSARFPGVRMAVECLRFGQRLMVVGEFGFVWSNQTMIFRIPMGLFLHFFETIGFVW